MDPSAPPAIEATRGCEPPVKVKEVFQAIPVTRTSARHDPSGLRPLPNVVPRRNVQSLCK
jgi:hypothetical protein